MYLYVLHDITGRGDADTEAEAGARLTCHLLLRLFKTVECPQPALYSVGQLSQWFIYIVVVISSKYLHYHLTVVNIWPINVS
jgi:hypothetical protein